jgi:hypothetical protein
MNIVQNKYSFGEGMVTFVKYLSWLTAYLGESTSFKTMCGADRTQESKDIWRAFVVEFERFGGPTDPNHTLSHMTQLIGPGYEMWLVTRFISVDRSSNNGRMYESSLGEAILLVAFDDVATAVQFKLSVQ